MQWNDKVFIVTGGSSGIGKALAEQIYRSGGKVAVCGRDFTKLQNEFKDYDANRILLVAADVSIEEDCKQLMETTVNAWGRIDVLICNAGISMRALFEKADLKVIRQLMDINFWGTVYCCKYALPHLRKSKGVITGVSSIAGYRGLPARTGYSSSKHAMQGFLEALRTELLHTGVHVMWVSPGFTSSNIRNTALAADGTSQKETPLEENKLMTAEACASVILKAIETRSRTVVMTLQGKLTVWINKLFPSLADKLVYKHFLKEPGSPLKGY